MYGVLACYICYLYKISTSIGVVGFSYENKDNILNLSNDNPKSDRSLILNLCQKPKERKMEVDRDVYQLTSFFCNREMWLNFTYCRLLFVATNKMV